MSVAAGCAAFAGHDSLVFGSPCMNIVGVDIGGTFTDLVGCIDGRIVTAKTSTVPADPTRGVAEGLARIIREGAEFGQLLPGEVLVAPYTNPAWTPLFQRAVAVVVDTGGAASHAAGSQMRKIVPRPTVDSTVTCPLCFWIIE